MVALILSNTLTRCRSIFESNKEMIVPDAQYCKAYRARLQKSASSCPGGASRLHLDAGHYQRIGLALPRQGSRLGRLRVSLETIISAGQCEGCGKCAKCAKYSVSLEPEQALRNGVPTRSPRSASKAWSSLSKSNGSGCSKTNSAPSLTAPTISRLQAVTAQVARTILDRNATIAPDETLFGRPEPLLLPAQNPLADGAGIRRVVSAETGLASFRNSVTLPARGPRTINFLLANAFRDPLPLWSARPAAVARVEIVTSN